LAPQFSVNQAWIWFEPLAEAASGHSQPNPHRERRSASVIISRELDPSRIEFLPSARADRLHERLRSRSRRCSAEYRQQRQAGAEHAAISQMPASSAQSAEQHPQHGANSDST
jgi:hypothetical protein